MYEITFENNNKMEFETYLTVIEKLQIDKNITIRIINVLTDYVLEVGTMK